MTGALRQQRNLLGIHNVPSLPLEINLQALENDLRIRSRHVVHFDENKSLKMANLGGFSKNVFM